MDIPGDGTFLDSLGDPIYDAWVTWGSGGFDLEAIGVISRNMNFEIWQDLQGLTGGERGALADPDGDGIVNLMEYSAALMPLAPDFPSDLQSLIYEDGRVGLVFYRDERAVDLVYEVEVSDNLQNWEIIARSEHGGLMQPVHPYMPEITEKSASTIESIQVIREVRVRDIHANAPQRFMRIRVRK